MSNGVEDARHVSMKLPSPSASSTANHGGGPLPKNPSGMLSTVSSSVIGDHSEISTGGLGEAAESGMVIEQWHYRPRGYAGCSSPVGGVILCILACLLLLLVFVVFYPMTTRRSHSSPITHQNNSTTSSPHHYTHTRKKLFSF